MAKNDKLVESDYVLTPEWCAKDIMQYFAPTGKMLDPCRDSSSTSADNQKDLTSAFLANLKQTSVENDIQIKTADLERKIASDESSKQIEMERLRLAHKELEERQKKRISDETIAYANKN